MMSLCSAIQCYLFNIVVSSQPFDSAQAREPVERPFCYAYQKFYGISQFPCFFIQNSMLDVRCSMYIFSTLDVLFSSFNRWFPPGPGIFFWRPHPPQCFACSAGGPRDIAFGSRGRSSDQTAPSDAHIHRVHAGRPVSAQTG